ncbi:MAG: ABC transporter substrate-binding protein [Chlamydiota bacterium]|nr:ABC transporter substrate-binding protein [Chlamydiota bacterium]
MPRKRILLTFLFFLCVFILWEILAKNSTSVAFILPQPSAILATLWSGRERFLYHSYITFKEMAGGIVIALSLAFPLGWVMYFSRSARVIMQPVFLVIQCIPMFTLAPIMVIWLGWSYFTIVIPTALMIFFPLTMNIFEGLKSTPVEMIDYFRSNKATAWQLFTKLQLPWAFPYICSGLRISAAIAGIGAVAGEWAGGQDGLGILMLESRRSLDLETCFAALFSLTILSLGVYFFTVVFEKITDKQRERNIILFSGTAWAAAISLLIFNFNSGAIKSNHTMVLDWLPNPDHIPIYVAIHKGFFSKNGLDIEVKKVPDPSDSIGYVASGKVDLAVHYFPDTVTACHRGAALVPVGKLIGVPLRGFIYRSGEGIARPSDLTGKVAGYCVDGSCLKTFKTLMSENAIYPQKMLNVSFDLVSSLGTKQVDFTYGAFWNIECAHLQSLGVATDYFSIEELGFPKYPELIFVCKEGSTFSNTAESHQFKKAIQESINFCVSNPQEAFEIYLQAHPDKAESVQKWEWNAWLATIPLLPKDQTFDQQEWESMTQWILDNIM